MNPIDPIHFWSIFQKDDGEIVTIRKIHLTNLYNLLYLSLQSQNYCRANRIVEILLRSGDLDIRQIWKASIEVLKQLGNTQKECVDFFNLLLMRSKMQDVKPYCNNALLNGYAGLLAFALLGQLEKSDQDNDVDGGNENGQSTGKRKPIDDEMENYNKISEPIDNEKIRYYDFCKRSFEKALDLDITNDMFLVYYVKLLISKRLVKEALNVIKDFNKENPNMITGKRLLFEVLNEFKKNKKEWVSAGIIYHKLDPVSPPNKILYPLINYYQSIINKTKVSKKSLADAHYNILELLLTRIEYGDNKIRYVKDAIKSFVWLETILETNLYNVLATLFGFIAFCTAELIYRIEKAILNHDDNALEKLLEVDIDDDTDESSDIDDKSHIKIIEDDKFDNDDNDIEKLPDIDQTNNSDTYNQPNSRLQYCGIHQRYPWDSVTLAFWMRYPNPFASHVESVDVIDRYVDPKKGILRTTRLILKRGVVPKWGRGFFKNSEAYILEESMINPKTQTMITLTKNITHARVMQVEERQTFRVDPNNPEHTQVTTEVRVISNFGWGLTERVEGFGIKKFSDNTTKVD
nr:15918_t:CDS:10 [Entrophospora candida]